MNTRSIDPSRELVLQRFRNMRWSYGDKDPVALEQLAERIAITGRRRALITYSELVEGVEFNVSNVKAGPWRIDVGDWSELDRAVVGSFLGRLAMRSYENAGFFSSALVVTKRDGSPSEGFYTLLRDLNLISSSRSDKALRLWAEHVANAHQWYVAHPSEVI